MPAEARARVLLGAGMLAHYAAEDSRFVPWLEESVSLFRTLSGHWGLAFALTMLGIVAEDAGDYDTAAARFAESLVHARAAEDPIETGLALFHLGVAAWGQGNAEHAIELLNEAVIVQRAAGDLAYGAAESVGFLGLLACEHGDVARSASLQRESLSLHLELGSREVIAVNLANVAMLAVATQRPAAAARLIGAALRHREAIGNSFKLPEREVYVRGRETARARSRGDDFAAALHAGESLSLAEAAADAFAVLEEISSAASAAALPLRPADSAPGVATLTDRELQIFHLLIEGRSDREIADTLFISPRTAQGHVARIFTKLNVSTRAAAVATALQAGLLSS